MQRHSLVVGQFFFFFLGGLYWVGIFRLIPDLHHWFFINNNSNCWCLFILFNTCAVSGLWDFFIFACFTFYILLSYSVSLCCFILVPMCNCWEDNSWAWVSLNNNITFPCYTSYFLTVLYQCSGTALNNGIAKNDCALHLPCVSTHCAHSHVCSLTVIAL